MKSASKIMAGGLLAAALVIGGSAAAFAHNNGFDSGHNHYAATHKVTGASVSNGTWQYGVHELANGSHKNNDSSYYNGSRKHRASVKNATGKYVRSLDKPAGKWAQATQGATASGNLAYWYAY